DTLDLCVGCKGCRRECPTGVDVARMKIEILYHYRMQNGFEPKEKLIGHLPRYAPAAALAAPLLNLASRLPGVGFAAEKLLGFSAHRPLPRWRRDRFRARGGAGEIV